ARGSQSSHQLVSSPGAASPPASHGHGHSRSVPSSPLSGSRTAPVPSSAEAGDRTEVDLLRAENAKLRQQLEDNGSEENAKLRQQLEESKEHMEFIRRSVLAGPGASTLNLLACPPLDSKVDSLTASGHSVAQGLAAATSSQKLLHSSSGSGMPMDDE
ncbi:unnamed protein product, partial [Polarella glacialis]